jgi:HEAT repeat protein
MNEAAGEKSPAGILTRRLIIGIVVVAVLVAAFVVAERAAIQQGLLLPRTELVHQGKPLAQWLGQLSPSIDFGNSSNLTIKIESTRLIVRDGGKTIKIHLNPQWRIEAESAVRAIGEPATPHLLALLRARETKLRTWLVRYLQKQSLLNVSTEPAVFLNHRALLGFQILGTNANAAVPELRKMLGQTNRLELACQALDLIGTEEAKAALRDAFTNESEQVRRQLAGAFGLWLPDSDEPSIKALLAVLADPNPMYHRSAIQTLGRFGEPAETVPAVLPFLRSEHGNLTRFAALEALGYIGPAAASQAEAVREAFSDGAGPLQYDVNHTLLKIEGRSTQ